MLVTTHISAESKEEGLGTGLPEGKGFHPTIPIFHWSTVPILLRQDSVTLSSRMYLPNTVPHRTIVTSQNRNRHTEDVASSKLLYKVACDIHRSLRRSAVTQEQADRGFSKWYSNSDLIILKDKFILSNFLFSAREVFDAFLCYFVCCCCCFVFTQHQTVMRSSFWPSEIDSAEFQPLIASTFNLPKFKSKFKSATKFKSSVYLA